ncbi:MAG: FadR/GntR family transcriptional regulator [Halanaerobium sp.]|nr:FadR/GntR family transcriptional regulator [Halanaerobium sp.]
MAPDLYSQEELILERLKDNGRIDGYKDLTLRIIHLIEDGDLFPNQVLPGERVLAENLNIGRSTVRTALKFLEFVGVIEIIVGKGAYVSEKKDLSFIHMVNLLGELKDNPFLDLLEARRAIETKMAALAAENATEEDLANLERAIKSMEKEIQADEKGVIGTDMFHLAIYKAAKNIILHKIGLMLQELMHESREDTLSRPGRAAQSLEEHRDIYEAIASGNSEEAARLMDEHLASVLSVKQ